jgi:hypothetical protein
MRTIAEQCQRRDAHARPQEPSPILPVRVCPAAIGSSLTPDHLHGTLGASWHRGVATPIVLLIAR